MTTDLITRFCTPYALPLGESDSKVLEDAERIGIPFDGQTLAGYCWGKGRTVLLVHGWGSRASHVAFLGRFIAKAGFRVVAYDSPAHSSAGTPFKPTSNLFEYCRAISAVTAAIGPLYAIVGHSFGAACAAFTLAGTSAIAENKISADKIVLISPPPALVDVYKSFCRKDRIGESGWPVLKSTLEAQFGFLSEDYTLHAALRNIRAGALLIHDRDDEEFPVPDILALQESAPSTKLFLTEGSGHQKILANRMMMARVKEHLTES